MEEISSEKRISKLKVKLKSRQEIEAHEIFFDSQKIGKDPFALETQEGRLEVPVKNIYFNFLLFLILFSFLFLFSRSGQFQIQESGALQAQALQNKTRIISQEPQRGIVYGRNFSTLVSNQPSFDLIFQPQDFTLSQEIETLADSLSQVLMLPPGELTRTVQEGLENSKSVLLASNLSHEAILFFETNKIPGFFVEESSKRYYQDSLYFSHILGYLGKTTKEDLAKNPDLSLTGYMGKAGLELYYQEILRGRPGEQLIFRDAFGKVKRESIGSFPEDGSSLLLHLDAGLQKKIQDSLSRKLKEIGTTKAVAVAIDSRNGGILALVSLPAFDNNLFSSGISLEDFEKLISDPQNPLFNRAISGIYASGSTVKPFLAAAALQEKVISWQRTISDPGFITVRSQYDPEVFYTFLDWKAHGETNMIKAIAESCNVYFYTIGGGYGEIKGLGIERIKQYLSFFGWGDLLGIDLPAESSGRLPDPLWKENKKGEKWYIGDTYNVSIGQGYLGITPLQVALATAVFANGGTLWQPQIVDKIVGPDRNLIQDIQPKIIRENFIDQKNIEVVNKGMREGVVSGTSWFLSSLPFKVAGKTGTAEVPGEARPNAWWTGFAPYDNPEIVLTILVENGGEGSKVAVPVAKEVLEWYFAKDLDRESLFHNNKE